MPRALRLLVLPVLLTLAGCSSGSGDLPTVPTTSGATGGAAAPKAGAPDAPATPTKNKTAPGPL
jgi:hypothetical protein